MRLVVRVPVLSVHMTEVQPRVSTEAKRLTITFRAAILFVPSDRHSDTTAGNPSYTYTRHHHIKQHH